MRIARRLWCAPNDALGLALAGIAVLFGGRARRVSGVVEVEGRAVAAALRGLPFVGGGAAALTVGCVVLGRDLATLEVTRVHERVHVAQYARWGPLFVPVYLALGARAWTRGEDPWRDHALECEAFAAERAARAADAGATGA